MRLTEYLPHIMEDLLNNKEINDFSSIYDFCDFIDTREDCNDFRMISLQRLYIQFNDKLPKDIKERIKQTILNFRYWMTEPGNDNMCYWSENHQLLFATIEYIGCSLFETDVFTNENKLGKDKIQYALDRINHWFDLRFSTGFIEWHSHVYYAEDLAALLHLIDFANDKQISEKAKIITDILFFDMASHSFKGNFALTHGRSYEKQKKRPSDADVAPIISDAFGFEIADYNPTHFNSIFKYRLNYEVPSIIKDIAKDDSEVIIKDQMGFDLKDIKKELDLKNDLDRFVLWQMESFTNPEIISHTIDMLNEYDLYSNKFLEDFKSISNPILRKLGLLPTISRVLRPFTDGVAIQKANTYTYKTMDYSMSTAQSHHPGECGDQHHIMNVCLGTDFNIFVTHPATSPYADDNEYLSLSPNNWVGNGRMPHSVQDKNINITMFKLPKRKAFMEKELLYNTHAYFPTKEFDQYDIIENFGFMKYGNVNLALIGKEKLELFNENELIQKGKYTIWITEVTTNNEESYDDFKTRIMNNSLSITTNGVEYKSNNTKYELRYKNDFRINDEVVNTNYLRFDTPYLKAKRYANEYVIKYKNKSLRLNLKDNIRNEEK